VRRPAREPTFLFVGVPEEHKQPRLAVAALAAYRARHGQGRLRFVGPLFNGHRELLEDAARHHGVADAVQVEGRVPAAELEAAWSGATAQLAESRLEGFGLPPVEAALRGVPVVAHDTPIARETLGDVATFVTPEPEALADAMEQASPPSAATRVRLAEQYSPGTVAAALSRAYDRLLEA
jgi:glycosyltransferase involved in cell wall biosynthesis